MSSDPSPDFTDTSIRGRMVKSEVTMSAGTRRRCTEDFKRDAVRLVRESVDLAERALTMALTHRTPTVGLRRHSSLGYYSPAEFEARTTVAYPGVHGIGGGSVLALARLESACEALSGS